MNMIVPSAISATPNGTTRPQVRIVIVGHVDHGKSTLVGRLLHETGSLPEGKLEMLKAVSARRGMPFEWSFLLDALQTERDQGITIDTTQIRFRTRSRDVVLIDPATPNFAQHDHRRLQADGAVLIVDALRASAMNPASHSCIFSASTGRGRRQQDGPGRLAPSGSRRPATRFPRISSASASHRRR
jgi:sulfate adenylyltransferase subunit 1 (EFTu-like GTPase family)